MDFGICVNPPLNCQNQNSLEKTVESCTKVKKKLLDSPIKNGYADIDAKITIISSHLPASSHAVSSFSSCSCCSMAR